MVAVCAYAAMSSNSPRIRASIEAAPTDEQPQRSKRNVFPCFCTFVVAMLSFYRSGEILPTSWKRKEIRLCSHFKSI
jgi:hypothetical protein